MLTRAPKLSSQRPFVAAPLRPFHKAHRATIVAGPKAPKPAQEPRGLAGWISTRLLMFVLRPNLPVLGNLFQARKTYRIDGTVADAITGAAVAGARVTISAPGQVQHFCETGYDGAFGGAAVPADGKHLQITIEAHGYRPCTRSVRAGHAGGSAKLRLPLHAVASDDPPPTSTRAP